LPDGSLPSPAPSASRTLSAASLTWIAGWTLPAAFVLLFVNIEFQPQYTRGDATVALSDLALLGVVAVAASRLRGNVRRLEGSRWLWVTAGAFLVFIVAASFYPLAFDSQYHWKTHLITAAKYWEYALLAPAVAVLAHDHGTLRRLWATVSLVSLAAAAVALVQFAGVDVFHAWPVGGRQPSFAGIAELGALGGAALAVGFVGLLWPGSLPGRLTACALVGGALDVALSGAVAAELGLLAAAVAVVVVAGRRLGTDWGRAGAVAAVAMLCAVGVLALRGGDFAQYARYLGLAHADRATTHDVQTYAHRQLIYYIGLRVWLDHPLLGAGWQSIREEQVYTPFLADAHRRFPNEPEQAFPSPTRPYGIDNAYIQALAELGLVGLALFLALLGTGLVLGAKRALRAPPERAQPALVGLLWLCVAMGTWAGQGLVAGSSFAALSWFALGLIAAAGSTTGA
jgi:O-antigen ligase